LDHVGQKRYEIAPVGFCLDLLADRGKVIGVVGTPQIFESAEDRRQVLMSAVRSDPLLWGALAEIGSPRDQNNRINDWLREIAKIKAHPISRIPEAGSFEEQLLEAYDAGLAASGAIDFDDLLLLSYRFLTEVPQVADLYRRIYRYICVDEAQDLNEAQYAVITALCGNNFRNLMLVGDPKQSIYGFNTSSPRFMDDFVTDFRATRIEMTENFRSSQMVVRAARALVPTYSVEGQLTIPGRVSVLVGDDEAHEATLVVDEIERLLSEGHPEIEGAITLSKCAVLGRNRYCIAAIEGELEKRQLKFRRLSAAHEFESELVQQFLLALKLLANPADQFHMNSLLKAWGARSRASRKCASASEVITALFEVASATGVQGQLTIVDALKTIDPVQTPRFRAALSALTKYADTLDEDSRRYVYGDAEILTKELDQYLRSKSTSSSLVGLLSNLALGSTQQHNVDGIALLTVHASKGLEFEVVFIAGMAEGIFPDYRATIGASTLNEELRNAFVAVTRAKRLLYLSYPKLRLMPWGDTRATYPSRYLKSMTQIG